MTTRGNVTALFIGTFDRPAAQGGLDFWSSKIDDDGWTIEMVAQAFFEHGFAQKRYPSSLSTEDFVTAVFNNVLDRDPLTEGLNFWIEQLDSGSIPRGQFIVTIVNFVLNSPGTDEFALLNNKVSVGAYFADTGRNNLGDAASSLVGVTKEESTVAIAQGLIDQMPAGDLAPTETKDIVISLFIAAFERAPAEGGLNFWSAKIDDDGWTMEMVAAAFFVVPETNIKYPAELSNEEFVTIVFNNVLDRDPTATGLAFWAEQFETGAMARSDLFAQIIRLVSDPSANQEDFALLSNKMEVGQYFADSHRTNVGDAILALDGVTGSYSTVISAKANVDNMSSGELEELLTSGQDTIVGAGGNDIISGTIDTADLTKNTFDIEDTIDGGAGYDILKIMSSTPNISLVGAQISNIEKLELESEQFSWSNIDLGGITVDKISIDAKGQGTSGFVVDNINSGSSIALTDFIVGVQSQINFNLDQVSFVGHTDITLSEIDLNQATDQVNITSEAMFSMADTVNTSISLKNITERSNSLKPGAYLHTLDTGTTTGVAINASFSLDNIKFSKVFGFVFAVEQAGESVNNIDVNLTDTDNVLVHLSIGQESSVSDVLTLNLSQVEDSAGRSVINANGFETVNMNIGGDSEFQRVSTQNERNLASSSGNVEININTNANLTVDFWDFSDYAEGSSLVNIIGAGNVLIEELNDTNTGNLSVNAAHAIGNIILGEVANNAVNIVTGAGDDIIFSGLNGLVVQTNGGEDRVTLNSGDDTLVYALATDSQLVLTETEMSGFDTITNFSQGSSSDILLLSSSLLLASGDERASVLQKGSISGADVTDMQVFIGNGIGFFNDGEEGARTVAFANDGVDGYLFIDANSDSQFSEADDMVIKLLGVTEFTIADVQFG